ncbi:hypothetical protein FGADI_11100 [Fusarium gaditjirri]|uniref:Uncharacterized protein n=1 Tax=Fusarium gaditjirri TaxID=282569 RepID=A0A8H4SVH1_9HYPO|nr:hypothetical protein FGADI_11100 [Fusarium gaditjirri]
MLSPFPNSLSLTSKFVDLTKANPFYQTEFMTFLFSLTPHKATPMLTSSSTPPLAACGLMALCLSAVTSLAMGTGAFMVCDATNMPAQEQYLTCETPTLGSQLECTCAVPEMQCNMFSGCTPIGNPWGTTYIGPSGGDIGIKAPLGPPSTQEPLLCHCLSPLARIR